MTKAFIILNYCLSDVKKQAVVELKILGGELCQTVESRKPLPKISLVSVKITKAEGSVWWM